MPPTPTEIILLLAMTVYAIYQQTQQHEVIGSSRYKLAIIYAVIGVAIGGFHPPDNGAEVLLLVVSLGLSAVVGYARGRYTRVWAEDKAGEGIRVYAKGTALTIGLFVGLVVAKFALGTAAYFAHVSDDGGFGEILVMIAVMVAFQAEIVWRRAKPLGARTSGRTSVDHHSS